MIKHVIEILPIKLKNIMRSTSLVHAFTIDKHIVILRLV